MEGGEDDIKSIKVDLVNVGAVGFDHSTVNRTIYHLDFRDCIPSTSWIFGDYGYCWIWSRSC